MKTLMRRDFLAACAGAALCAALAGTGAFAAFAAEQPAKRLPTVWLIGDSTVNNHATPQAGWGDYLQAFFDESRATVQNKARGGRSSRTFLEENLWAGVRDQIQSGDFVLMQFGHNDGGPLGRAPFRASLPGIGDDTGTFDEPQTKKPHLVHSYGWYLTQFIREAKAKGATPVVLSPVPRNMWSKDNKTVNRAARDYGAWAREVAQKEGVPFVDLNAVVAEHYEAEGQPKVNAAYFTTKDHTHTSPAGARLNAQSVAEGVREGAKTQPSLLPLAALLRPTPKPFIVPAVAAPTETTPVLKP